jgi:hypothetical protein
MTVKLNELMLYAKCVTIRDNQVEQKVCYFYEVSHQSSPTSHSASKFLAN